MCEACALMMAMLTDMGVWCWPQGEIDHCFSAGSVPEIMSRVQEISAGTNECVMYFVFCILCGHVIGVTHGVRVTCRVMPRWLLKRRACLFEGGG